MSSSIDFGRHSDDYATFRPGPPPSFYERLDAITPIEGSRSLDLGTGPGTVALELAARGSSVVGVDRSEEQIAVAGHVAKERSLEEHAVFRVSAAEATSLDGDSLDLVTACQAWHWFDRPAALEEVRRVLRPGGVLVIVAYSYLAPHSPVAGATEELILRFNPSWSMAGWSGVFPEQIDEVIQGGFEFIEAFCYDHQVEFSHARWRGRMRTCNGVGSGGLPPAEVERFDAALGQLLREEYPEPLMVPHRVWCVAGRKPS